MHLYRTVLDTTQRFPNGQAFGHWIHQISMDCWCKTTRSLADWFMALICFPSHEVVSGSSMASGYVTQILRKAEKCCIMFGYSTALIHYVPSGLFSLRYRLDMIQGRFGKECIEILPKLSAPEHIDPQNILILHNWNQTPYLDPHVPPFETARSTTFNAFCWLLTMVGLSAGRRWPGGGPPHPSGASRRRPPVQLLRLLPPFLGSSSLLIRQK